MFSKEGINLNMFITCLNIKNKFLFVEGKSKK